MTSERDRRFAVRKKEKKDIGLKRGEEKVDPLNYGGGIPFDESELLYGE